jgi:hypothetical protein
MSAKDNSRLSLLGVKKARALIYEKEKLEKNKERMSLITTCLIIF